MIRWAFVVSVVALAPATPEKKTVSPAARARVPQVRTTTQTSDGSPQPRVKKSIARPAKKLAAKAARKPIRVKKPKKNKPRVAFVPCSASLPDQAPQPSAGPKIAAGMDGLVAERAWLWPNGATLNVHFLDGTPEARKAVAEVALAWTKHAN